MPARTFQRWLVVAAVIGLAVAGYFVWRAPPPRGPQQARPSTPPASGPATLRALAAVRARRGARQPGRRAMRYIDAVLGHQVFRVPPRGVHPQIARQLLLDDDKLLLSSGRRLWTRELAHQPGPGRRVLLRALDLLPAPPLRRQLLGRRPAGRAVRQPVLARALSEPHRSSTTSCRRSSIDERKFITYDDRAVATYAVTSTDKQPHTVTLEVDRAPIRPFPAPATTPGLPAARQRAVPGHAAVPLSRRTGLHAPRRRRLIHLRRDLAVPAAGTRAGRQRRGALRHRRARHARTRRSARTPIASRRAPTIAGSPTTSPTSTPPTRRSRRCGTIAGGSCASISSRWTRPTSRASPSTRASSASTIRSASPCRRSSRSSPTCATRSYGSRRPRTATATAPPNGAVVDPPGSPYWGETYSHWIAHGAGGVQPRPSAAARHPAPPAAGHGGRRARLAERLRRRRRRAAGTRPTARHRLRPRHPLVLVLQRHAARPARRAAGARARRFRQLRVRQRRRRRRARRGRRRQRAGRRVHRRRRPRPRPRRSPTSGTTTASFFYPQRAERQRARAAARAARVLPVHDAARARRAALHGGAGGARRPGRLLGPLPAR